MVWHWRGVLDVMPIGEALTIWLMRSCCRYCDGGRYDEVLSAAASADEACRPTADLPFVADPALVDDYDYCDDEAEACQVPSMTFREAATARDPPEAVGEFIEHLKTLPQDIPILAEYEEWECGELNTAVACLALCTDPGHHLRVAKITMRVDGAVVIVAKGIALSENPRVSGSLQSAAMQGGRTGVALKPACDGGESLL